MKKEHPIAGRQYQLTGGTGEKCISNGNTWEESDVMKNKIENLVNDLNPNMDQNKRNLAIKTINGYWDAVGKEISKMVVNKHNLPQTTQNYYGSYLELLGFLTDCRISLDISGIILILAGANIEGVKSSIKITKGI